jgi:hypothetical protein
MEQERKEGGMKPILFTKIVNTRGPLSKAFALKNGQLQKTAAADLVEGRAIRTAIKALPDLAMVIEGLGHNEALTFGITSFVDARVATQKALSKAGRNTVARDRKHFFWPEDRAILQLDIDKPKDGSKPLKAKEFDALLCRLLPWWRSVARMYKPSASAFVFDDAGNELSGAGSLRAYAIVDKGENIPHLGVAVTDALWRAGYGRIEFGAAGQALVRCPVDGAVWQPERLDFQGAPILGKGLTQKKFPPLFFDGVDIVSEQALASGPGKIAFSAWQAGSKEVRIAKNAAKPEEKRRRNRYIDDRVRKDVEAGADKKAATQRWQAAVLSNTLRGDFVLHFRDRGPTKVTDVLANVRTFHLERCADPLEPAGYGGDPRIAQFYANQAPKRPSVFSHAHGGCRYALTA